MRVVQRSTALVASAFFVVGALAGCASDTHTEHTPGASAPEPSPPAASPAASDANDPVDWVISFEGVGPLTIGGSLAAGVPDTGPAYVNDSTNCPAPEVSILKSATSPTIWVVVEREGSDAISSVSVGGDMADDRMDGSPSTEEGITVGSTVEQLTAAYPSGEWGSSANTERFILANDAATRHIVFGVQSDVVNLIHVQTTDEPIWEFCG